MKPLKLLIFGLVFALISLSSCTNDDLIIEDSVVAQESAAMQAALDELRTLYNPDGTVIDDMHPTGDLIFDFCFEFVYPIELIYNNGSTVTINSLLELIEALIGSTNDLYIVGIVFPFDVEVYNADTNQIEVITIHNEEEFLELLESCFFR